MAYQTDLSTPDLKRLAVGCFHDLALPSRSGFIPIGHYPDLQRLEQVCLGEELVFDLQAQIEAASFSPAIHALARKVVEADGRSYDELTDISKFRIGEAVARAQIEAHQFSIFRVNERLAKYQVGDEFLRKPHLWLGGSVVSPPATQNTMVALHVGPSLREAIKTYFTRKAASWRPKSTTTFRRSLEYLAEHLGEDRPLAAVTVEDMRSFRNNVEKLRQGHHNGPNKSFVGRQTEKPDWRIDPKTAANIYGHCNAFFRWATDKEHYLASNPANGITVAIPKQQKGKKSRLPFNEDQIRTIFTAPVYTGMKSRDRRFVAGDLILKDARYFVPLVGFYTGARLGEIIQLSISDVKLDGEILYFDINEQREDGGSDVKHVKTNAGLRRVPIHPDLVALGFVDFVEERSLRRGGVGRLFYEVAYGADGVPSTGFSKWFHRFLAKLGLADPRFVFHSFRHGMEDALRNALIPQYVIDRIIGHTDGETHTDYGEGAELAAAYAAIKSAKMKVSLPALLADHRPDKL
jgi:integrase